jgi:hypothetical protein
MNAVEFVVTDPERGVHVSEATWGAKDAAGAPAGLRADVRTLHGGRREGVQMIELSAGALRVAVVPTRGMALWKAWRDGVEFGWQSPVKGPVHPAFVPLAEPSGRGWLDGFDELLCRCGLESNGAPEWDERGRLRWPLHGWIGNSPAHRVVVEIDAAKATVAATAVVDESRLFGSKLQLISTTRIGLHRPVIEVLDRVMNRSGEAATIELLYHVNFGAPVAAAGARLHLPVRELAPRDAPAAARFDDWDRLGAAEPGRPEEVFFAELLGDAAGRTEALIAGPGGTLGASLRWPLAQLPRFSLWKNPQLPADGCVTGLEPATNYPNARSFEERAGRLVTLEPGAARDFSLELELHCAAAEVARARTAVDAIQSKVAPRFHPRPLAHLSPDGASP